MNITFWNLKAILCIHLSLHEVDRIEKSDKLTADDILIIFNGF